MKFELLIIFVLLSKISLTQNLTPTEFIINSTIKIETLTKKSINNKESLFLATGTGFFFVFTTPRGDVPVIVTNGHVIKGSQNGTLYFKTVNKENQVDYNKVQKVEIKDFDRKWIKHPDSTIDLAILPIAEFLEFYANKGIKLSYAAYTENEIPSDSVTNTLTAIEDILMIGYPFGLKDVANDLPVVRKGITATPPYLDYNFKKEFLCDISVYPGSSGSPILIYNSSSYTPRTGGTFFNTRLLLLGINYATYTKDFEGKITPKASYNIEDSIRVNVAMPYNIGIIIKSSKIFDFKRLFY